MQAARPGSRIWFQIFTLRGFLWSTYTKARVEGSSLLLCWHFVKRLSCSQHMENLLCGTDPCSLIHWESCHFLQINMTSTEFYRRPVLNLTWTYLFDRWCNTQNSDRVGLSISYFLGDIKWSLCLWHRLCVSWYFQIPSPPTSTAISFLLVLWRFLPLKMPLPVRIIICLNP